MKIEVTIEVDPDLNTRITKNYKGAVLSWIEKSHFGWQSVVVNVDGDTVMDWTEGTPTPRQLEAMRREVVQSAVYAEMAEKQELTSEEEMLLDIRHRMSSHLKGHYEALVEDLKANPDSEWVKRHRRLVKAQIKKRQKSLDQLHARQDEHRQDEAKKQDLIRNTIDYEIARQDVLRSNGLASVNDHRIAVMVAGRVEGYGDEDPTPTDELEQKTWERICRSVEAEAMFDLPRRFTLMDSKRHLSFDFS